MIVHFRKLEMSLLMAVEEYTYFNSWVNTRLFNLPRIEVLTHFRKEHAVYDSTVKKMCYLQRMRCTVGVGLPGNF